MRVLLLALLLLAPLAASAQQFGGSVHLGGALSWRSGPTSQGDTYSPGTGLTAGAAAGVHLRRNLVVELGLTYAVHRASFSLAHEQGTIEVDNRFTFIQVPLIATLTGDLYDRVRPYVEAGGYVADVNDARNRLEQIPGDAQLETASRDYGLIAGLGAMAEWRGEDFFGGVRLTWGLADLRDTPAEEEPVDALSTRALVLLAGFRF